MQRDSLAKLALGGESQGFIATSAGNIEINAFAVQLIGFDSAIKETKGSIVVTELIMDNGGIDIDLASTQEFIVADKNLAGGRGIAQSLGSTI